MLRPSDIQTIFLSRIARIPFKFWEMPIIVWIFVIVSAVKDVTFCQAQDLPYPEICTNIEELSVPREWDKFSTPELIAVQNYPSEIHEVRTIDGYILTMHRIPRPGANPVFILHGMVCSSRDFFMQRGNNSLGFILHNAGYVVWFGNMRGNDYSLKHKTLETDNPDFWKFSLDQIAKEDVPAMLNYIYGITTMACHCIGYSMGSTVLIEGHVANINLQKQCRSLIGLAPIGTLQHIRSLLILAGAKSENPAEPLKAFLYAVEPTGQFTHRSLEALLRQYLPKLCDPKFDQPAICQHIFYILMGMVDPEQIDNDENCHYWSTNTRQNKKAYNQSRPPPYDLSKFNVPNVVFFVGPNDHVATDKDVKDWSPLLGTPSEIVLVNRPQWAHLDFMWAKEACYHVYGPLLDKLRAFDA